MSAIDPKKRTVLVTGVGFRCPPTVSVGAEVFSSPQVKPNMGSAVALRAAQAGYSVVLLARTEEKLAAVRASILEAVPGAGIAVCPVDVLDRAALASLEGVMPGDREVDLVQCAGLSSGSYGVADDNPYLLVQDVPPELPTMEFDTIVRGLLNVTQRLLPRWLTQVQTRAVVVNSMSGIRPYPRGYAHASAKAGLHHAVRTLALELAKKSVLVSEVNPGAVDTGFYDAEAVKQSVTAIALEFGYDYRVSGVPQLPVEAVADAVLLCLTSAGHVLSVDVVARGQFPHHGA